MKTKKLCILLCEVFRREAGIVRESEALEDVAIEFYPARCGRASGVVGEISDTLLHPDAYDRIEVVGGSCYNPPIPEKDRAVRVPTGNSCFDQCFYLVADATFVNEQQQDGAYVITPGWLVRYRRHLADWGFAQDMAREFFRESCSRILLLDTGAVSNVGDLLSEFGEFVDRPYASHYVGTGYLALTLLRIVARWRSEDIVQDNPATIGVPEQRLADYAMSLEMIGKLAQTQDENEVVRQIGDAFMMLFSPRCVFLLPIAKGVPGPVQTVPYGADCEAQLIDTYHELDRNHLVSDDGSSFMLRICNREELVALIEVDQITFPQYLDHYLNMATNIVGVCGLALANARKVEQIRMNLKEKETLLKEIHHRVKNNMFAVSSLLNLTMSQTDDEKTRAVLQESQNRIQTISLVHRLLYESETLSVLDMRKYLSQLVQAIVQGFGKPENVELRVDIEEVYLPVKQASPIGLIVNELLTNCFKYAFPDKENGTITLTLTQDAENQICLNVRDTGIGISESALQEKSGSIGLSLVQSIAEKQLDGMFEIRENDGTDVLVTFHTAEAPEDGSL